MAALLAFMLPEVTASLTSVHLVERSSLVREKPSLVFLKRRASLKSDKALLTLDGLSDLVVATALDFFGEAFVEVLAVALVFFIDTGTNLSPDL
jgi:hypothetical protein